MKIVTLYAPPPIPQRQYDWVAWVEGSEEDGPFGWGSTEQAAIDDLNAELDES